MSIVDFSDVITFSRASAATYFDSEGVLRTAPAGVPRIDYDPVTGECRGLLVEEQRTNLLTYSDDFSQWSRIGSTSYPVPDSVPDGSPKWQVVTATAEAYPRINNVVPLSAGVHTLSVYVQAGSKPYMHGTIEYSLTDTLRFFADLSTLRVNTITTKGTVQGVASLSPAGDGIYRISVTVTITSSQSWTIFFGPSRSYGSSSASIGDSIKFRSAQLEEGSFPTSYIPTAASQVTRAADVARVNNLSPWFNDEEGTWKVRAQGIVGRPLLTAGSSIITVDSAGVKDYTLTYNSDPGAEFMQIGQGHIQKIEYYPSGNVGGGNA